MAQPCSACLIADDLMRGLFDTVAALLPDVIFEVVTLTHPRECSGVPGLEIESLPAVIIGDEQVTAGGLLHRRALMGLISERM